MLSATADRVSMSGTRRSGCRLQRTTEFHQAVMNGIVPMKKIMMVRARKRSG